MKLLLALAACVSLAAAQCGSKEETKQMFGNYLGCIKSQLDGDYNGFENEFQQDNKRAVQTCFADSIEQADAKGRCVLTVDDLKEQAWSRNGPLRECNICRTFATGAIKAVLSTSEPEQRCIREEITKAVTREADYCLNKKLGASFAGVPPIPDLEEQSFAHKDMVIKSISDFITIKSRLAFCGDRKPERADATDRCMSNPFVGYFTKHCQLVRNCDAKVPNSCSQQFGSTKSATCQCIDEARLDLKKRVGSIAQTIRDSIESSSSGGPAIGSASTADRCVSNIKAQLVTPVNDWLQVIGTALTKCLRSGPGKSLTMESMLSVGCRKVISDSKAGGAGDSHRQLKIGFDFINNLIDAMVDRSKRFCGGPQCN
uniref:Uncharacterized protein n=1 Tax=Plectus sambesii TaxID=2011161 RepID=A0A914V8P6_9BILA